MDYNLSNNKNKNNKISRFFGCIVLIIGILVFAATLISFFNWYTKKVDYNKEYVYSNQGVLYYEKNDNYTYVVKTYNTNNKEIKLDIPNKETALMYCKVVLRNECIYLNYNTFDKYLENPLLGLILSLALFLTSAFLLQTKQFKNKNSDKPIKKLSAVYLFAIFLFIVGIIFVGIQTYSVYNYITLKNENNVVKATIYSKLHNKDKEDSFIPIAYYYVDDKKYIFEDTDYTKGKIEDYLDKKIEIYYNKNNPKIAMKTNNPLDIKLIIIGTVFILISIPLLIKKYD